VFSRENPQGWVVHTNTYKYLPVGGESPQGWQYIQILTNTTLGRFSRESPQGSHVRTPRGGNTTKYPQILTNTPQWGENPPRGGNTYKYLQIPFWDGSHMSITRVLTVRTPSEGNTYKYLQVPINTPQWGENPPRGGNTYKYLQIAPWEGSHVRTPRVLTREPPGGLIHTNTYKYLQIPPSGGRIPPGGVIHTNTYKYPPGRVLT